MGEVVGGISKNHRKGLRWRMTLVLLAAALLPVALAGFGSWIVFGNLLEQESLARMRTLVQGHARAIEAHLSERIHLLQLAAQSHSFGDLRNRDALVELLENLNDSSDLGFVDLGVIDSKGDHIAYVGPYRLESRNYRETDWFKDVSLSGIYISDVFLGFRQVPHCIIAIKNVEADQVWFLRATIDSDQLDNLVKQEAMAADSDAYIINVAGVYQTTPRRGTLMGQSPMTVPSHHSGVRDSRVEEDGVVKLRVTRWLAGERWLLVVERGLSEIREPVDTAIAQGAIVVALAAMLLIFTTILATWHLTSLIEKSEAQREEMSRAFIRSAKFASIGELATGLAHEINNPLAVIIAEQTNISDLLSDSENEPDWREQALHSVARCKAQIQRCASITRKMLQFGRNQESHLVLTDVVPRLEEIAALLERRASVRNVSIAVEAAADPPRVLTDPLELEQVIVNLINNAMDAMPHGGKVTIEVHEKDGCLNIDVVDRGTGIPPEQLDRIFEPFFTTKPPGRGTGLGLSVCYGMVHSWGGRIRAVSSIGKGTTLTIELPLGDNNLS